LQLFFFEVIGNPFFHNFLDWPGIGGNDYRMLKISPGTLHTLRSNGKIPYTRIGGLIFYDAAEIKRFSQDQKQTA
jgi:hypothetical protein